MNNQKTTHLTEVPHYGSFLAQLKRHEGFSSTAYIERDGVHLPHEGTITIGWGFNISDVPLDESLLQQILDQRILKHLKELKIILPLYHTYTVKRKHALLNMHYNLGMRRFLEFKKMLAAIHASDWQKAALEMEDSKWYTQVGQRADELIKMIEVG